MVGAVRALTGKFGGPKFNFCPDSYLTIISQVRLGSDSTAHEAKG